MRKRPDIVWIRVGDLRVDPSYQRDKDKGWVRKLGQDIARIDDVPTLDVVVRSDGTTVVVDGWHRASAVWDKWGPDTRVPCKVHEGLTHSEEAALFYRLNQRRNLKSYNKFHARVCGHDDSATTIVKILHSRGLDYGQSSSDTTVCAVAALDAAHAKGDGVLERALDLLIGAWGFQKAAWEGLLISGAAEFVYRYPEADLTALAKKVAKHGGPSTFMGEGNSLAATVRMSKRAAMGYQFHSIYNLGKRGGALPPWK